MGHLKRLLKVALPALIVASPPVLALHEVMRIPIVDAPAGTAGLGGSVRVDRDPYFANGGKHDFINLIPLYLFEGRYLFAHGTVGGIHVIRKDRFQFNLIGQFRFQDLSPSRDAFYEGIRKRKHSFDSGIEFIVRGNWGQLKLDWTTDTINRHNGQEVDLAYRYNYERGRWSFSPYLNWTWQDENLTNYYYGVSAVEARPDRPAYSPGEAYNFGYGMNTSYQLTDRTLFFANVGLEKIDPTLAQSPLVEESMMWAALIGGTYMFGNVERPTAPPERQSEWSWRVNYGYQADGKFVGEIDRGDFSESTLAKTQIAGLTLSRLLNDGPRADYYGRIALYRHLEEPFQKDFNSYVAYIMAIGKGYSPWSGNEVFRWGFGFGMSYADKVPALEVIKQTSKGLNTSRFLSYLEMTLDFPLRRVIKKSFLRNCYAGVTVVHRSGIFGSSGIHGDVAGGANWITAHLECMQK